MKYLHGYRTYPINKLRISPHDLVALKRWNALERFERALSKGLSSGDAAQIVGVSKATLYRWKARKTAKFSIVDPEEPTSLLFAKNESTP
ncbi:MAG: helix-turn-helix domain-containing protein [Myxococcaceae bacterium]|nr:helix-turn-helix domain-containing protein [Myxococcaceae bacterium]